MPSLTFLFKILFLRFHFCLFCL